MVCLLPSPICIEFFFKKVKKNDNLVTIEHCKQYKLTHKKIYSIKLKEFQPKTQYLNPFWKWGSYHLNALSSVLTVIDYLLLKHWDTFKMNLLGMSTKTICLSTGQGKKSDLKDMQDPVDTSESLLQCYQFKCYSKWDKLNNSNTNTSMKINNIVFERPQKL